MIIIQPDNITALAARSIFAPDNYRIFTKSGYTLMPFTNKISGIYR